MSYQVLVLISQAASLRERAGVHSDVTTRVIAANTWGMTAHAGTSEVST